MVGWWFLMGFPGSKLCPHHWYLDELGHCDEPHICRISIPAWWDLSDLQTIERPNTHQISQVSGFWHLGCLDPELFCLNSPFFGFVKPNVVDSAPTCILLLKYSQIFLQHTFELREFFRRPVDLWGLIRLDRTGLLGRSCLVGGWYYELTIWLEEILGYYH